MSFTLSKIGNDALVLGFYLGEGEDLDLVGDIDSADWRIAYGVPLDCVFEEVIPDPYVGIVSVIYSIPPGLDPDRN